MFLIKSLFQFVFSILRTAESIRIAYFCLNLVYNKMEYYRYKKIYLDRVGIYCGRDTNDAHLYEPVRVINYRI